MQFFFTYCEAILKAKTVSQKLNYFLSFVVIAQHGALNTASGAAARAGCCSAPGVSVTSQSRWPCTGAQEVFLFES